MALNPRRKAAGLPERDLGDQELLDGLQLAPLDVNLYGAGDVAGQAELQLVLAGRDLQDRDVLLRGEDALRRAVQDPGGLGGLDRQGQPGTLLLVGAGGKAHYPPGGLVVDQDADQLGDRLYGCGLEVTADQGRAGEGHQAAPLDGDQLQDKQAAFACAHDLGDCGG